MTQAWNTRFSFIHKPIPAWAACLFILLLDAVYNYSIRHLSGIETIGASLLNSVLYTAILFSCIKIDLVKITICYLALPYLFFFPGWLNTPTAILMTGVFVYCTYQTVKKNRCAALQNTLTIRELFAFLLIIVWVNLSGAGGYGYQSWDYVMHNSRLNDLVEKPWPVYYGKDLNLVYYVGYYLPSAVIGKLMGNTAATVSMFYWALLGATLTIRWASLLSGWKLGSGLVFAFIFFGPMDAAGILWLFFKLMSLPSFNITMQEAVALIIKDPDILDFWASTYLQFFIGNFLSNTFQFYWAPQHIIPGWLCISLITYLFLEKNIKSIVFIFCLLCLWSPLVMLAMAGFVLVAILYDQPLKNREWITVSNTIGSLLLVSFFLAYYMGGSALVNYSAWTLQAIDAGKNWDVIVAFYFFAWGIYLITMVSLKKTYPDRQKTWLACLVTTMLLLPLYHYGEYSDLLCRGSAPVMFLLMIFLLQLIREKWNSQQKTSTIPLLAFLAFGSASALLQIYMGITHYGENRAVIQVTDYKHAAENLGSDNTFFARFLRGEIQQ